MTELPLGKATDYPDRYAPDTLCRIARADNRGRIGLGAALPFSGTDIWNAWDLTWLARAASRRPPPRRFVSRQTRRGSSSRSR